jgi:hypothetical protein
MPSANAPLWLAINLNCFVSGFAMSVRTGVGALAGVKRKMINNEEGPTATPSKTPRRAANFDTVFLPVLFI